MNRFALPPQGGFGDGGFILGIDNSLSVLGNGHLRSPQTQSGGANVVLIPSVGLQSGLTTSNQPPEPKVVIIPTYFDVKFTG